MKTHAIIGAAFGDEGKGLMTDFLAANHSKKTVVVRFNGGAQAGHTVQTASNQRHVFKHIGSGSFAGAATFLSEFFICNPLMFQDEFNQLINFNLQPKIYVHKDAIVTTPYDMMINQIVEEMRNTRHGSCGVGINETVERNLVPEFALKVDELFNTDALIEKLHYIQKSWVEKRLAALGVKQISDAWEKRLTSAGIMEYFLDKVEFFVNNSCVCDNEILRSFEDIIFEGAQGLMLDEVKGFFPHVTRSSTGLKNIISISTSVGIAEVDVFYMTRAYLTRHGNGPLPFELGHLPYSAIVDPTNVTNVHQGALRFAWLNLDLLQQAIFSDLEEAEGRLSIQPNLVVTCMDQLDAKVRMIIGNKLVALTSSQLLNAIQDSFTGFKLWGSFGPTRATVIREQQLEAIAVC